MAARATKSRETTGNRSTDVPTQANRGTSQEGPQTKNEEASPPKQKDVERRDLIGEILIAFGPEGTEEQKSTAKSTVRHYLHQLFEVVVIDEASQVSVAQAFPALLRASKVIVFGDHRQFSNAKAANASILRNQTYLTDIQAYFRQHISDAADRIQRLKQFDVKKSILDFFKLIANYEDMLRKHFRGYHELISFSSEHFYEG